MNTNIAVIIPVFNGSKYLCSTLDSVLAQSQLPSEIIVVDDGSQDESVKIAASYSGVKVLSNPFKGAGFARNFGFQQTKASLVAFLDQDDIWQSEHLLILSQILEKNPEYPAVVASAIQFYQEKKLKFPICELKTQIFNPWQTFPSNSIFSPSTVLIQRQALLSIGGWPIHIKGCTDIYTWLRLTANQNLIRSGCATVGYRRHFLSNSNQLRLEKIDNLVKEYYSICGNLIDYRIAHHPQEKETLTRRLNVLSQFELIIKVSSSQNKEILSKCLENLDLALAQESQSFRVCMCNVLIWFLYPHLTIDKNLMLNLLTSWSNENYATFQAMQKALLSKRIFWEHFLVNLLDFRFWILTLKWLLSQKMVDKLIALKRKKITFPFKKP